MNGGSEKLRGERRVVHGARGTDGQALRSQGLARDRKQASQGHVDGTGPFDVRAATEAVVCVLREWSVSVILHGGLGGTQLWHEQVGRRPRQQEAGHDADDDVPADGAHCCHDTGSWSQSATGRGDVAADVTED